MQNLHVGDITLTSIEHFDSFPMTASQLLPDADPRLWETDSAALAPDHWESRTGEVRIRVQSWLIRSDGITVLVDTGLAPTPDRDGVPTGGDLPAQLAAAGITAEEIDVVVCTHLHADHVGWNTHKVGDEYLPLFPNAQYLMSAPDVAFFAPDSLVEEPGRSAAVYRQSISPVLDAGQAVVWDRRHTIDDGITIELAPGHTPGHAVVSVESGGDRAQLVGDALHTPLQLLAPTASSCFCHDRSLAARTRLRLLEAAADTRTLLVPAHFAGTGAVEVQRRGAAYAVRRWAA